MKSLTNLVIIEISISVYVLQLYIIISLAALVKKIILNINTKLKVPGIKYRFQFTTFITTEYNVDLLLQVSQYSLPWLCYTIKYNILCLNVKKVSTFDSIR